MPYQSNPPTSEESSRYGSKHRFVTALGNIPRFEIRPGRLAKAGFDRDNNPVFIQKRVDCMVGVDRALLAGKRTIDNVALFTGDSDLIPTVEAVKREGIIVTLWHGSNSQRCRPSDDLVRTCDERRELDAALVKKIYPIRPLHRMRQEPARARRESRPSKSGIGIFIKHRAGEEIARRVTNA